MRVCRKTAPRYLDVAGHRLDNRAIAKFATQVRLPAGTPLTREGQVGKEVFLLVDGAAEVATTASADPVATLGPGDVCGEMAILGPGRRRTATAVTTEPTEVLVMTPGEFQALVDVDPAFATLVAKQTAARR